jgi:hypothetical protein
MMNPFRSGFYAVQLFSHKVMRYLVPFFLVATLITSITLAPSSFFYMMAALAQALLYLAALAGRVLESFGLRNRFLALPQYFVLANLASLIACYKFLSGERYARWETVRESVATQQTATASVNGREG